MKKLIVLTNILALSLFITNCTSSSNEDGEELVAEEATTEDGAAVAEENGELKAEEKPAEESATQVEAVTEDKAGDEFSEELPADDNSAIASNEETIQPVEPSSDPAAQTTDPATQDQAVAAGVDTGTQPPSDQNQTVAETSPTAEVQTPVDQQASTSTMSSDLASNTTTEETKPAPPSLKKVESAPFRRGGQLLNAVYVARPGDDFKSISQMIYGTPDKATDLATANAWMKSPKPGDKVYYNSPTRPDDKSKLLSYYEEQGITPEVYVTQEGDHLKKVSETLLGYPNAWKEVWATNLMVESKSDLPAGTELKYWKTASSATPPPAQEELAQQAPPMPEPEMMAPPVADNPPPPVEQPMAMAPPPPVEAPIAPPVEPPPVAAPENDIAKTPANEEPVPEGMFGMDNEMMMNVGAGALVLIGALAFITIRRKKAQREKAIADAFDSTQVG